MLRGRDGMTPGAGAGAGAGAAMDRGVAVGVGVGVARRNCVGSAIRQRHAGGFTVNVNGG